MSVKNTLNGIVCIQIAMNATLDRLKSLNDEGSKAESTKYGPKSHAAKMHAASARLTR